jgi:hypothetical protein
MTQPLQPQAASNHARHDTALIAALADRKPGLEPRDLARARELVSQCDGCRDLLADLVIIRDAIPVTGTPARPRTFTLTTADARRLRATGWRRFIGFFGSARDGLSRPLAIGFTTIGIVALVVTASPLRLGASTGAVLSTIGNSVSGAGVGAAAPQSAASAAAESAAPAPAQRSAEVTNLYASAAASAAASYAPAANPAPSPAPSASSDNGRNTVAGPIASGGESGRVFTGSNDTDNDTSDADEQEASKGTGGVAGIGAGPSLGIVVGGLCLILGIMFFALRWTARRLAGG